MRSSTQKLVNKPLLYLQRGFLFLVLSFSFQVQALDCGVFSEWLLQRQKPLSSELKERNQDFALEYDLRLKIAQDLYQSYASGDSLQGVVSGCVKSTEAQKLVQNLLSKVFLNESISRLKQADLPALKDLLKRLDVKAQEQGMTLFRAVPHFPDDHDIESTNRAGVYRGTNSLFMNYDNIPAGEWMFLLVHELAHYLDPVLHQASEVWNKTETPKLIFENKADATLIKSYVRAGLDRGLLAEYRAWKLCLSVYEQGKLQGLWQNISWMEDLLRLRKAGEGLDNFIFRYLDGTFTDPEFTGLFSLPSMQQEYLRQREELRSNPSKR